MSVKKRKQPKPPTLETPQYSARKIWFFRVFSLVLIPLLLFGSVESALRLAGVGYPTRAIIEKDIDGKTLCLPNTRFTWRFFPKQIARELNHSLIFEKEKPAGTFRIFIVGGSAALGTPEPMHNFGRYLEVMLNALYPDIRFEVNNAAVTAVNSHVVRDIVRDCAEYDPDMFIVYLGNNEVVGPYGPGTVFTRIPPALPLIRANLAVKSTRIGQLFDGLVRSATASSQPPRRWTGLEMFLDHQVCYGSEAMEAVYHNFEQNLRAICATARNYRAAVVLSSVGANLKDCPPFSSQHKEGLSEAQLQAWEQAYQQGCEDDAADRDEEALEHYQAAAAIDETYAELHYRIGLCYWNLEDFAVARDHFEKAMEYDTLRVRADARINETIRCVAESRAHEGIFFVDSVEAFEAASPNGIIGEELFYEHVHMNFRGNYTLARALIPAVQEVLSAKGFTSLAQVPTEDQVADRVAFTDFEHAFFLGRMVKDMVNKPPFTYQLNHDEWMQRAVSEINRLRRSCDIPACLGCYDAAIQADPEDWRLVYGRLILCAETGQSSDLQSEEVQLRKILQLRPVSVAYENLGRNLSAQGRLPEAKTALNQLLELRPNAAYAHYLLGEIALKQHDYAKAAYHARRAIALAPAVSIASYTMLAKIYDEAQMPDKGIRVLNKALDIFPEPKDAGLLHIQLGNLLFKTDQSKKAIEHMNTAFRIQPEYAKEEEFKMLYDRISNSVKN